MDLSGVFSSVFKGKVAKQAMRYLAVKISAETVAATVWTIKDGKTEVGIISEGERKGFGFDELLAAVDKAVSEASPEPSEVSEVIFAVPNNWVMEGKITPGNLKDLRRLCKELELKPLGYVVTAEALENFLKEVEGAPLTAILLGLEEEKGFLTIYRAGKDLGTLSVSAEEFSPEGIVVAMEKELRKFSLEVLPARIILYDGKSDLEKLAQKITAHPWTGRLPFLHFPKVEIIPADMIVKAVAGAGAVQMGASLSLGELGSYEEVLTPAKEEYVSEEERRSEEKEQVEEEQAEELEEVSAAEAGFMTEVNGGPVDIPMRLSEKKEAPDNEPSDQSVGPVSPGPKMEISRRLTRVMTPLLGVFGRLSLPSFRQGENSKLSVRLVLAAVGIILIVLLSGAAAVYFLPKVTVRVTVATREFNHEGDLAVISGGSEAPGSEMSVAGNVITVSEIGSKKGVATGSKLVGTKARGSVTIYSVFETKAFPAGTILTSTGGLKFTLDSEVQVASGDAVSPATVKAGVTAVDIGDKYNLASGDKFTLGSLSGSAYLAKNDDVFSGGASHQATVVTKSDQDRLAATLSAELSDNASKDLGAKLRPGEQLLPNAVTFEISKKKFSRDIDSETDTLTLDLTVDFRGVVFSKDEVVSVFAQQFATDIPTGYGLTADNAKIEVKNAKTDKKGNTTLTVAVTANLTPKLESREIIKNISGKNVKEARAYITTLPGVSGVNVEVSPRIIEGLVKMMLPVRKEAIRVEIVTQ